MKRHWIFVAVLLAGLGLSSMAHACPCTAGQPAGFIHAHVKRLPSNARGALFLPPADGMRVLARPAPGIAIYSGTANALGSSAFSITTSFRSQPEKVQVTALDLERDGASAPREKAFRFARKADEALARRPDWQALLKSGKLVDISAEVRAATRLLRVGPVGGFLPGYRYTIAYLGKEGKWSSPAKVEHIIDSVPAETGGASYTLAASGSPQRQLLARATGDGSCGSNQPAIVQYFWYLVPESARPYQNAILYFSESRAEGAQGYVGVTYQQDKCTSPGFGASAGGFGADLVEVACDARAGKISIRGWAGLLEVEDRLHRTDTLVADFGKVSGTSCSGFGMLKEAFASQDPRRVKAAACAVGNEGARDPGRNLDEEEDDQEDDERIEAKLPALAADQMPASRDLLALATASDPEARRCGREALLWFFHDEPQHGTAVLTSFADVLVAELGSANADIVDEAVAAAAMIRRKMSFMSGIDDDEDERASFRQLLRPVLPSLVDALASGKTTMGDEAARLIADFGPAAQPYVAALRAVAESSSPNAVPARNALAAIAPADPVLDGLFLRDAGKPGVAESSALAFDIALGKAQPAKAIALLTDAARLGSDLAIDALGAHGRAGRASIPALIEQMWTGKEIYLRSRAFSALLKVSDGEPEVIAAIARTITAAPDTAIHLHMLDELEQLHAKGATLLPAINVLMQRGLDGLDGRVKVALAVAIESMELPPEQERQALARLAKATTR